MIFPIALLVVATEVHVVDETGAGDFTDIQPAVDAAVDGDVVLVKPGTYGAVEVVGKTLTIAGERTAEGFAPSVYPGSTVESILSITDLAANQRVHVRDLSLRYDNVTETALSVEDNVGPVVIENVRAWGWTSFNVIVHGAQVIDSSSVAIIRSQLYGGDSKGSETPDGGAGLQMYASSLYMYDSICFGGDGAIGDFIQHQDGADGGQGAEMGQGFFLAIDTEFRGGFGGEPNPDIISAEWGTGGAGLVLGVGIDAWLGSNTYTENIEPFPGVPFSAHALATFTELDHEPRAFEASSPHIEGESTRLTFEGPVGEATVTFVSPFPLGVALFDPLAFILPAPPFIVFATGAIPTGGLLELDLPVGSIGASEAREVFCQPVFVDAALDLRVGTPSMLLIVNDSL